MPAERAASYNPFEYQSPVVDPDAFIGREWELQFIFEMINKGEFVSIVGGYRAGKSSLLRILQHERVQDRYLSSTNGFLLLYFDLETTPFDEPDDFLATLSRRIAEKGGIQNDTSSPENPWSNLEEHLSALLPRRLARLALSLDQFDRIGSNPNFSTDFYDTLRGLVVRYDISLTVTTREYLHRCVPDRSPEVSPFFNIFRVIRIDPPRSPPSSIFSGSSY